MDKLNNQIEQAKIYAKLSALMEIEKLCLEKRAAAQKELEILQAKYKEMEKENA